MITSRLRFQLPVMVGVVGLCGLVLGCGMTSDPAAERGVTGAAPTEAATAADPSAAPASAVVEGPEAQPPAGFPADLIYAGSKHERSATTPNELHLASTTPDAAAKVVAFYESALPRAGFKPVSILTPDASTTIVMGTNGARTFSATILTTAAGSRIELAHKLQDEM